MGYSSIVKMPAHNCTTPSTHRTRTAICRWDCRLAKVLEVERPWPTDHWHILQAVMVEVHVFISGIKNWKITICFHSYRLRCPLLYANFSGTSFVVYDSFSNVTRTLADMPVAPTREHSGAPHTVYKCFQPFLFFTHIMSFEKSMEFREYFLPKPNPKDTTRQ